MSKKDAVTKEYMSKRQYFADAFNAAVFDGRQIVKADDLSLEEKDSAEVGIVFANEEEDVVQKYRDILKKCIIMSNGKMTFLLLGIENQCEVHYAMPVRNLIYDALNYGKQVSRIASVHKMKKDLRDAEFLSGFSKADKILPVITLVVYFGSDKWDGPRSLKDMFSEDIDEEILNEIEDYKIHLIVPSEIKDFSKFKTDLGKAMKYIAVSEDKMAIDRLCEDEDFGSVGADTLRLINECTGSEIEIPEGEDVVNMCNGLKELLEDKRILGREEGIKEGKDELLNSLVWKKLRKNLSLDAIADALEEDVEVIRPIYEKVKKQMESNN